MTVRFLTIVWIGGGVAVIAFMVFKTHLTWKVR